MASNDKRALILGLVGIIGIAAIVILVTQLRAWAEYHKIVGAAEDAFTAGDYDVAAAAYQYAAECYVSVPELAEKAATAKQLFEKEQRALFDARIADGDICLAKKDYMGAVDSYLTAKALPFKLPSSVTTHLRQAYIKQGEHLMASCKWEAAQNWYAREFFGSSPELHTIASDATKRSTAQIQAARKKLEAERHRVAAEAAKKRRVKAKAQMCMFEGSPVAIAVGNVEVRRSISYSTANSGYRFILLFVNAMNLSDEAQHVNPNDFTLADSDGYTVSHDSATYGLDNYFDAVTLAPGKKTAGWIVFLARKDGEYTLYRNDYGASVEKRIIIE